jgi:hypothetical protein
LELAEMQAASWWEWAVTTGALPQALAVMLHPLASEQ